MDCNTPTKMIFALPVLAQAIAPLKLARGSVKRASRH
jgi:hypothetical protein